jgi:hypothetical protein
MIYILRDTKWFSTLNIIRILQDHQSESSIS